MKRYITATFALLLTATLSYAQLPTSGDWLGTSDGQKSRRVVTQTVNLAGNVNLYCTIIIGNGVTLTINNASTGGVSIYNKVGTDGRSCGMFNIEQGGKLIINGAQGKRITLGCGGNFSLQPYSTVNILGEATEIINSVGGLATTGNTIEMGHSAILNQGALELNYVTIQNVCNSLLTNQQGGTYQTAGGAIVHSNTATSTKMDNCTVNQCYANSGSGVFIVSKSDGSVDITDTEFKNCINYTQNSGLHGGVIRGWGDSGANVTLTRVKIHHCYSAADAGAIYFPSNGTNSTTHKEAVLTLNNCEFYNNCSETKSGALDICANLVLSGTTDKPTKVHHNYTKSTDESTHGTGIGGGIAFRGYDSGSQPDNPVNIVYNADERLEVYKNKALRGGGIAFFASANVTQANGSSFTLNVNGALVHDNEATYGGGIWMRNDDGGTKGYEFHLNLNSGQIYSNTATYGGGLFITKWEVASSPTGTIKIQKNIVSANAGVGGTGGALYLDNAHYVMESGTIGGSGANKNKADRYGGGIYLTGGSHLELKAGEVSYNWSGSLGGGAAILGGSTLTFSNGNVNYNETEDSGGGLYCNASTLVFNNGECSHNTAGGSGGGACILSGGTVTFKGNIKNNSAKRGGGVSLNSGSSFTMTGGIISGNEAKCDVSGAATTTYNARNDGFGGGIFVFNTSGTGTTTLTIDVSEGSDFGLYNNKAAIGGNDITSSGVGTSVTIPSVRSMELAGFPYGEANPNWYEDYNPADSNYNLGVYHLDASTNARYEDQLTANTYMKHLVPISGGSHTFTEYLNLTLGYELLHIIVKLKNLMAGDTALFRLIYAGGTANEKVYPILFNGTGETTLSQTIKYLNYGHYRIEPVSGWQWKYSVDPGYYDVPINDGPEKIYTFTLSQDDKSLETDEKRVVNKIGGN